MSNLEKDELGKNDRDLTRFSAQEKFLRESALRIVPIGKKGDKTFVSTTM